MTAPTMCDPRRAADDTEILSTHLDLPGLGVLPVNAFLIHAAEPVLVDTGIPALADDFVAALRSCISVEDLRWIWVTHNDPDHVGALARVLELAPKARVVTTFLGMGKSNMVSPLLSPDRVWLLRPGQRLHVGDRDLLAMRPPTFDAPETTALFDERTRALFSADSFGALLPSAVEDVRAVPESALRAGSATWATIDNPWIHGSADEPIARALSALAALRPSRILSAHLPPAPGELLETLGGYLREARDAAPFEGPDQHDLMQLAAAAA